MFIKSFGNFLKQEIYEKFLETFKEKETKENKQEVMKSF